MSSYRSQIAVIDPAVLYRFFLLLFVAIVLYTIDATNAHATAAMGALCNAAGIIQGTFGRGLATLGIIAVGVGATIGKVSWTMAITVAVGIAILFSASTLSMSISGGAALGCNGMG